MLQMNDVPILVIGGGVAGSACALRLRQHGIEVHVAEKTSFPRTKVCGCCLGGAGLETLRQLRQRDWVMETGVATRCWQASIGGRLVELALPTGVAISRQALDSHLLGVAADQAATVWMPCQASLDSVDEDHVTAGLVIDGQPVQQRFSAVVVASGLTAGGLQTRLPWKETPHGPFGISFTATSNMIEPGVIYMACDADGYVGLVQLEDGRVDIAAALVSGSGAASNGSPGERVDAILTRSEFPVWELGQQSPLMTTPPLRRTRIAGSGRLLAIGDAAGYSEPFTGEGMTWAMQSGIAAADTIAASIHDLSSVGQSWDRQLGGLLRKKKWACRTLTGALRWDLTRRTLGCTLANWPSLATPLIRSLNRV